MCLDTRTRRQPNRLTVFGLCALAIANSTHFLLQRSHRFSDDIVDPVSGFLIGIAIATLLLGIRAQSRRQ